MLPVSVGGVYFADALVDTGSSPSMMSRVAYQKLKPTPALSDYVDDDVLVGIGGCHIALDGDVVSTVSVNGRTFNHPVVVTPDSPYPVIVGMDIVRAHGSVLDVDVGPADVVRFKRDLCPL